MVVWLVCMLIWGSVLFWLKKIVCWIVNCGNCWWRFVCNVGSCMLVNEVIEWVGEIVLIFVFYDCDLMNVVWYGNYFKYFEIVCCVLFGCYDYDYL